jgi:hypothetical protein
VILRKKRKLAISRAEALKCIPVKNMDVTEIRLESGEVLLNYPVGIRPWMAKIVGHLGGKPDKTQTKKIQLDMLGTSVWDQLDGISSGSGKAWYNRPQVILRIISK